jgi:hypothetical protein
MSTPQEEWQSRTENGIKYTVKIGNFENKMKSSSINERLYSKLIYIGESSFKICIIPKLSKDVCVYLQIQSNWKVKGLATFSAKDISKTYCEKNFEPSGSDNSGRGFGEFAENSRCTVGDLMDEVGSFTLEANIKLPKEAVTLTREAGPSTHFCSVDAKIENLKFAIEKNMTNLQSDLEKKFSILVKKIRNLKISAASHSGARPTTECPVCMEVVKPPMRLMQCRLGHIVCDDCFVKA